MFARADSSGSFTPLTDALGSTVALVDANGNLTTQYSYDPFGNTTASGAGNGSLSQYTGRENEGNGLYYYRNRYYSPLLGRFVNEDPSGDGLNFYAYVDDDPINFSDPFGLQSTAPALAPVAREGIRIVSRSCGIVCRGMGWGGVLFTVGLAAEKAAAAALSGRYDDPCKWPIMRKRWIKEWALKEKEFQMDLTSQGETK